MAPIEPVWLFGLIALACGVFLGMLINRKMNPSARDNNQLKVELDAARTEMDSYKKSVNSHFNKTSDLVNELTQDYVKVYRHLAEGAQTLSDTREFTQVLDQPQGQVLITVEDSSSVAAEADAPVAEPVESPADIAAEEPVETPVSADAEVVAAPKPEDEAANVASTTDTPEDSAPVEIVDYDKAQNEATDSVSEAVAEDVDKKADDSRGIDALDKSEAEDQKKSGSADTGAAQTEKIAEAQAEKVDEAQAESAKTAAADTADSETPKKA